MTCTRVIDCGGDVHSIAISPDNELLTASSRSQDKVVLWQHPHTSRSWACLEGSRVKCMAFSPAGSSPPLLVTASHDGVLQVWDCNYRVCVKILRYHGSKATHVAFSPDGRLLAVADCSSMHLLQTDDWSVVNVVNAFEPTDMVSFSCDNRLFASHYDKAKLWHILDAPVAPATIDAARNAFIGFGTGPNRIVPGLVVEVEQSLYCSAFSPVDNKLLACGGHQQFLALMRVCEDTVTMERKLQGHTDIVICVAFSPCGQTLASGSGSDDKTVRVWNVATGVCLQVLRGHMRAVKIVSFFPNGKQLASFSSDRTVRIWTLCAWSDRVHHLFSERLKAAVFTLMCVRARLEQAGLPRLPRLPMEVWLLAFGQLQLALGNGV